jgi:hypothetical protein
MWRDWNGLIKTITSNAEDITIPAGCTDYVDTGRGTYEWNCYCSTGSLYKNCTDWVREAYGTEFTDYFGSAIADNRLLVKVVKRTDFIDSFSIYLPLQIFGGNPQDVRGMYGLKNFQIPIQIYGFKVHNIYRYFTEGQEEITVYPIRI